MLSKQVQVSLICFSVVFFFFFFSCLKTFSLRVSYINSVISYLKRVLSNLLYDLGTPPPHVAQGNFAEIDKIILKSLCFSLFFINFDNM